MASLTVYALICHSTYKQMYVQTDVIAGHHRSRNSRNLAAMEIIYGESQIIRKIEANDPWCRHMTFFGFIGF